MKKLNATGNNIKLKAIYGEIIIRGTVTAQNISLTLRCTNYI